LIEDNKKSINDLAAEKTLSETKYAEL